MKKKSDWEKMKEFINSHQICDCFTRQDMLRYIYGFIPERCSTVDTNRRMLVVCRYLADTKCAGKYTLLRYLEPELTSSELRKMYDKAVKSFVDPFEWYQKCWKKSYKACKHNPENHGK